MAKYYGKIGFSVTSESVPGVWSTTVLEKYYYGDIKKNTRKYTNSDSTNDDILIGLDISILADPFALSNFNAMKYAEYLGVRWKIDNVSVQYPRLLLTLGNVYTGSIPQEVNNEQQS